MSAASAHPRGPSNLVDTLDRVLDRGIVIDADMRVSVGGLNIVGVEARIVVAGIETYLKYADAIGSTAPASWTSVERRPSPDGDAVSGLHVRNRIGPLLLADDPLDPPSERSG